MTRQGDGQFFILRNTLLCRRCGFVVCLFQKTEVLPLTSSIFSEDTFLRTIFYALCGDISLLILPWCLRFFPLQTVQDHLFHVCTLLWCDVTLLLSFSTSCMAMFFSCGLFFIVYRVPYVHLFHFNDLIWLWFIPKALNTVDTTL